MKFAQELFPKGTFKTQKTDGAYINEVLANNLDTIAKKIKKDMHFLGIISGHDMVGDGKSTLLTHVGSYLTWKINKLHGTNNTFTDRNLVFNSKNLTKRSFELPQYSVVCLDEGDDLTTHGMKDLAVRLKRYFRKCRQLNQIVILILPSFFELPKFYALSRSHFLIDVMFQGEYERGYFKFYGPNAKKQLYLKGKKDWNYDAHKEDFEGRFFSSYCFFPDVNGCIERYKHEKYQDMIDDSEAEEDQMSSEEVKTKYRKELFYQVYKNLEDVSVEKLANAFGVTKRTGFTWLKGQRGTIPKESKGEE